MTPEDVHMRMDERVRALEQNQTLLMAWREEVMRRNQQIPGWLFAAVGLIAPFIGWIITTVLAGRIP